MTTQQPVERGTAGQLFWRFWFATTVSGAGSAVTLVALPLVALSVLDASAFEISLLSAAGQVGWLVLGLPAGVIVQRHALRGLQVTMDLVRTAAIGSIPLAWWLGQLTYTHLVLASLVVGLATVLFDVGNATFLPAIVEKDELNARNSLMSGTVAVTQTGGPSLGGLLVQIAGPVGALLVDMASYLASALTLRSLPDRRPERPGGKAPATRLIREGWTYVVRHPVMMPCMVWATAANFVCAGLIALTPTYLVREAGASAGVVGLLIAMEGVGSLVGSLVTTRLATRFGTARAMVIAGTVGGLSALTMPLTTGLGSAFFFAFGNAGFAAGVVVGSIVTRTHRQTDTPPELLSRVMATVRFVSWGALPLGAAASGVLASLLGLRPALWVVCSGALAGPLILVLSRIRSLRNLSDVQGS
jgi:MFS family permease